MRRASSNSRLARSAFSVTATRRPVWLRPRQPSTPRRRGDQNDHAKAPGQLGAGRTSFRVSGFAPLISFRKRILLARSSKRSFSEQEAILTEGPRQRASPAMQPCRDLSQNRFQVVQVQGFDEVVVGSQVIASVKVSRSDCPVIMITWVRRCGASHAAALPDRSVPASQVGHQDVDQIGIHPGQSLAGMGQCLELHLAAQTLPDVASSSSSISRSSSTTRTCIGMSSENGEGWLMGIFLFVPKEPPGGQTRV